MEGRWTIRAWESLGWEGDARRMEAVEGPLTPLTTECAGVPVVPCDDAAIERVAAKLAEIQGYHAGPLDIDRRSAVELLRAAGETP